MRIGALWNQTVVGVNAKKQIQQRDISNSEDTEGEQRAATMAREREEYKVIIKLTHDGASFGEWNPIQLTKIINRMLGEIKIAKVLRNGSLLVVCRDSAQRGKAMRLNKTDGKSRMLIA